MVTKPCRWRWPPRAGGPSGSCHGKQPRVHVAAHPRRVQCLLCALGSCSGASLVLEHRAHPQRAPLLVLSVAWAGSRDPAGASILWAIPAPGRDPAVLLACTHSREGSWAIPPLLAGAARVPQQLLAGVAQLPCSSGDWVGGDSALPTLPLAVITCQQLL